MNDINLDYLITDVRTSSFPYDRQVYLDRWREKTCRREEMQLLGLPCLCFSCRRSIYLNGIDFNGRQVRPSVPFTEETIFQLSGDSAPSAFLPLLQYLLNARTANILVDEQGNPIIG